MGLKEFGLKMFLKGKLPNFVYRMIGKKLAKAINLQEGNMAEVENKKWYTSKGVLTGIVTVLISLYEVTAQALAPQFGWNIPPIPAWVFTMLGALGIYSRVVADKKIG